uniref:BRCA1/BRCA2-containing complex subunit 45 n=1 Tax=Elaeophora elaphi TaxID=1147741 RepID=A0A0R3RUB3_9BILA
MEVPLVPWDDFLIKCKNIDGGADTPGLFESEWEWLKQLCELAGEDCCSEVNNSFQQVTLTLRLDASSYFLKLHWTESFPSVGPEVVTSLGSAFLHSWQNDDTLCSLYHCFVERCLKIDTAVKLCSDVKYPFIFMEWAIDEDDPTCIAVTLLCNECIKRKSFQLFLAVDWSEPNTFPRRLTSSVPESLQGLRLDEWDSSNVFADNLTRIFRNIIS